MKLNQNNPAAIALYTKSSILVDNQLKKISLQKITRLSPNVPIYSNIPLELDGYQVTLLESSNESDFLKKVTSKLPGSKLGDPDIDEVFFIYNRGYCPLLSYELSTELLERHKKYLSQYSYSENLPEGIVPFFISREFMQTVPDKTDDVHSFLLKNINNYDTEIFYKEPDLRQMRLNFNLSDYRSILLSESILKINPDIEYKDIYPLLLKDNSLFRSVPSYLELEIYRGCDYKCIFCPRQYLSKEKDGALLSLESIQKILSSNILSNSKDITICFGGMGEPLLHPNLDSLVLEVLNFANLKELVIETSLGKNIDKLFSIIYSLSNPQKEKLSIIVNLSTLSKERHSNLYGSKLSDFENILQSVLQLNSILSAGKLNVQILKIKEVEDEIETYFNFFEEKKISIILQKYNRYTNLMPERRVSDLTPIHREFCWHLTRDLYIDAEGNTKYCRQMVIDGYVMGSIHTETLDSIWEKGSTPFSSSINGNHKETGLPCLHCDEWYTFNA